jgi:hypothetical protein
MEQLQLQRRANPRTNDTAIVYAKTSQCTQLHICAQNPNKKKPIADAILRCRFAMYTFVPRAFLGCGFFFLNLCIFILNNRFVETITAMSVVMLGDDAAMEHTDRSPNVRSNVSSHTDIACLQNGPLDVLPAEIVTRILTSILLSPCDFFNFATCSKFVMQWVVHRLSLFMSQLKRMHSCMLSRFHCKDKDCTTSMTHFFKLFVLARHLDHEGCSSTLDPAIVKKSLYYEFYTGSCISKKNAFFNIKTWLSITAANAFAGRLGHQVLSVRFHNNLAQNALWRSAHLSDAILTISKCGGGAAIEQLILLYSITTVEIPDTHTPYSALGDSWGASRRLGMHHRVGVKTLDKRVTSLASRFAVLFRADATHAMRCLRFVAFLDEDAVARFIMAGATDEHLAIAMSRTSSLETALMACQAYVSLSALVPDDCFSDAFAAIAQTYCSTTRQCSDSVVAFLTTVARRFDITSEHFYGYISWFEDSSYFVLHMSQFTGEFEEVADACMNTLPDLTTLVNHSVTMLDISVVDQDWAKLYMDANVEEEFPWYKDAISTMAKGLRAKRYPDDLDAYNSVIDARFVHHKTVIRDALKLRP